MAIHPEETSHPPNESSNIVSSVSRRIIRPVRPLLFHLLPLAICLLCIPILLMMSGAAGWLVWRGIPTGWSEDVYLQYGDSVNPYANVDLPHILHNQPYDVSLHLVIPATESNFALGNFMTSLRFSNSYNETLVTVRRPAVLVSNRPSYLKQLLMSTPSTIKLQVPLLSKWVAGTNNVKAYIELGRYDVWKSIGNGQARELSVVQATLKGSIKPTGIRSFSTRYPRLATFLSSFVFFFFAIIVVMVVILCASGRSSSRDKRKSLSASDRDDDSDPEESVSDLPQENEDVKPKPWVSRGTQDEVLSDSKHELTGIRKRIPNIPSPGDSAQISPGETSHIKMEEDMEIPS